MSMLKRVIPKTGQQVSRLGFGSFRVSQPIHAQALTNALEGGINIIDTGSNFENGASESLIGDTMDTLIQSKKLNRESITLVSKAGYLGLKDVESLDAKDYVQLNEKSFHSLSPKVLEQQIHQSLQRLKTNKLDIFMLNAPERMLMSKNRRYTTTQLYKDMAESFGYLDGLVKSGTIGGYGVCSNTMSLPTAADHVSLRDTLAACNNKNNLVAIQVPFNLYEREAVQSEMETIADIAEKHDIYFMTNRPLNAIANGQIRVLVNHELGANGKGPAEHEIMEKMTKDFEKVTNLETDMMVELPIEEESLSSRFVWGQVLSENLARLAQNHFATRHYLTQQVLPAVQKDLTDLHNYAAELAPESTQAYNEWIDQYKKNIHILTEDIVNYAYIDTLRKNNDLDRILCALCPTLNDTPGAHSPLSIRALRFLLAHEQVGTIFTGMRDPLYVKDALFAAKQDIIDDEDRDDIWRCPIF